MPAVHGSEQLPGGAGREAQAVHANRTTGLQHPADGAHENSQVRDHEIFRGLLNDFILLPEAELP